MAVYRVVEKILKEHYVEAPNAETAKDAVKDGYGADIAVYSSAEYDWEVVSVEPQEAK